MTVLIADDHKLVGDALSISLTNQGFEVVGATMSPGDVLPLYRRLRPDLVVLDVSFSQDRDDRGLIVAQTLLAEFPDAKVVFCSMYTLDDLIRRAYALKAAAYIPKETPIDAVAETLRQVHEGGTHILPSVAQLIAQSALSGTAPPQRTSPFDLLDERERQVITMVAKGWHQDEICETLGYSGKTISLATQSAKAKLGVSRTADITLLAIQHGIIPPHLEPRGGGAA